VSDVLWSTAVQHGVIGATTIFSAVVGTAPFSSVDDATLIRGVYAERGRKNSAGTLVHFPRSPPKEQAALAKRFLNEQADALEELAAEPGPAA
jgi:hypothetical protein